MKRIYGTEWNEGVSSSLWPITRQKTMDEWIESSETVCSFVLLISYPLTLPQLMDIN